MKSQAHAEKNLRRLALGLKPQGPSPYSTDSSNVIPLLGNKRASDIEFIAARLELIRIAAHRRAEKRGFAPGAESDDWLAAEAEIDARLQE